MNIFYYSLLVLSFMAAQGYALYSEQRVEQARNQSAITLDRAVVKAKMEAVAFEAEKAKWTPTYTPDKGKPSMTATATVTATVGKEKAIEERVR
jgi:hypothetical protein